MTTCAVEKCLDYGKLKNDLSATAREDFFESVVLKFDMLCIAVKCTRQCKACKVCHYALQQIQSLVKGRDSEKSMCPRLEGCVENCVRSEPGKAVQCVAARCNIHCYDGDCPSCRQLSKRMFSRVCKDLSLTRFPQVSYQGECPDLFQTMADDFVMKKKKRV
ncbi:unnamed protein product, partial [Mesorhabditis belari]|uniref:Uncharacterized protein n=1 Tax=Mesorhabditis belari TaxID=2138241 RepID=A0AAF3EF78_9BILA